MPGEPIDNRALMKRTIITVGAMVGASIVLVGTLTLVASTVVGRAVGPAGSDSSGPGPHVSPPTLRTPAAGAKSR